MYLTGFNKFRITDEVREAIKGMKQPKDLEIICEDIKVCGRREYSDLLKLRLVYVNTIDAKNRSENDKIKAELKAAKGP